MPLDDIKVILGISESDTSKDSLLNIYIRTATTRIINYLKIDSTVDVEDLYSDAILEFVVILMAKRGNEGLTQFSQGAKSGTYGNDLPDSVISLLPSPRIVMR